MHLIGSDEEGSQSNDEEVAGGRTWECMGPFPSGMREHPLTASPLHTFVPSNEDADVAFAKAVYDENFTWPSELADGGRVGWKKFKEDANGWVNVRYPEIRWQQLRSDHGWAALQYRTILRTPIYVPTPTRSSTTPILIDAQQAVEYAFVGARTKGPVIWYSGDMYDFAASPTGQRNRSSSTNNSNFARSICLPPGEYMMMVRAIYEIRLFGDPGNTPPTIRFKLDVEVDTAQGQPVIMEGLTIAPDVVDGRIMGEWMAFGLRVPSGQEDVVLQSISCESADIRVEMDQQTTIVSGQTRRIALRINQRASIGQSKYTLSLDWDSKRSGRKRQVAIPLQFRLKSRLEPFKFTFPSPVSSSTGPPAQVGYAIAVPPVSHSRLPEYLRKRKMEDIPVVLALHGAGVDVEWEAWIKAMPVTGSWSVLPTGKNEWGEDWHGASMADAWAARDALVVVLKSLDIVISDQTLLIGHSNGGQGAWHLASRYPDRIVGIIGAAGYIKIQDYVPFTELTSSHYADPALMGILSSSLSPYNNDLYLSNLAHIPCLAIHGGSDTNVLTRHSRSYANIISSWQHDLCAVEFVEVKGEDHWWEGMMRHPRVEAFVKMVIESERRNWDKERRNGFTLTTACPDESGGRAGIRIAELETPGRMARLDVNAPHWQDGRQRDGLDIRGMNVKRIEIVASTGEVTSLDGKGRGLEEASTLNPARIYGPMIRLLSSPGPLIFVCGSQALHLDIAKRLAHDVFVHHRLDSEIVSAEEGLIRVAQERVSGNMVIIGTPFENAFTDWLVEQKRLPLRFPTKGVMEVDHKVVYENGAGLITLHPHPTVSTGLVALIAGNDDAGLCTAARLFPLRTGVQIPDWAVVGPRMSWQAAGGLIGAGFWNGEWKFSKEMSWFDR